MSTQSQHLGIVVGVDGTPSSTRAVDWAAREAARRASPLTLVHVVPTVAPSGWLDAPMDEDYWGEREEHGRKLLDDASAAVGKILGDNPSVHVRTTIVHDEPVPALANLSKEADLVVAGCRGLGALPGILLGSVSRGLVHHASSRRSTRKALAGNSTLIWVWGLGCWTSIGWVRRRCAMSADSTRWI